MDPVTRLLMQGAAGAGGEVLGVEDVFSTYLYTGNNTTNTITNGIDLVGEGGLVWTKGRDALGGFNYGHNLFDTERGVRTYLVSSTANGQVTAPAGNSLTSFNSDGFTLGTNYNEENRNLLTLASWTFRKAPKFFDVVTYTGDGIAGRTVSHNLGSVPGFMIVKSTSATADWICYHRSLGNGYAIYLNTTEGQDGPNKPSWNQTSPTSTEFTVGVDGYNTNNTGTTYVAYLFAHDAGGFGAGGTESVIKCGSFTTDGSGNIGTVSLGWEPQWILTKRTDNTQAWYLWDSMRGMSLTSGSTLSPNNSDAEVVMGGTSYLYPTATGFAGSGNFYGLNATVAYIAIRRGPMKTPEDATTVFTTNAYTGTGSATTKTTGFPVDLVIGQRRENTSGHAFVDRLRGRTVYLTSTSTNAESTAAASTNDVTGFDVSDGYKVQTPDQTWINNSGSSCLDYAFRRAPGFFDVVGFTSDASGFSATYGHSLGVAPELVIIKARGAAANWYVWHTALGSDKLLYLDRDLEAQNAAGWASVSSTQVAINGTLSNNNLTHISYLFATCPGVSKVGSYTGTGTTLNVDCGFASGARFVLIKRTDSTGDWYVWDTARGIVSGDDPYLLLNSTAAEVTNTDYIDPLSSGFQISSTAPAAINASGGSFVFLAIS